MSKRTITHEQHLQVQGLCLLAAKSVERTDDILHAVAEVLGVNATADDDTFVDAICDPVWGKAPDAAVLILAKLDISVEQKGAA